MPSSSQNSAPPLVNRLSQFLLSPPATASNLIQRNLETPSWRSLGLYEVKGFINEKDCIYKLSRLFCSLAAFMLEILIASTLSWRLWEFDSNVVQFVSFGLWEAYYPQQFNISGKLTKMLVYTPIDSTWNISTEFMYAQNLIISAILMKPVVLLFSVMAIKISCMKNPLVEMQIYFYKISALTLSVSSMFTFVSVIWNHVVDLYGQTTLDFPYDFPVKKEALRSKHLTLVLPVGLLISTMSLFGVIMFLSEISNLKLQRPVKANDDSKMGLLDA
ncbi:uncharacterized protein LOC110303542 [Mus caroli]|uniref:Uncharacterized protein LOC110303542 n=1 Tax=Mus caroli TaxID=10089 RepID=A0A6P5QIB3_MUSCR|nr:uncharacterized protein LOC110303542 [Mus caroli]